MLAVRGLALMEFAYAKNSSIGPSMNISEPSLDGIDLFVLVPTLTVSLAFN